MKNQMVNSNAPVVGVERFGDVVTGFIVEPEGRIFYLEWSGEFTLKFQVFEDGSVSMTGTTESPDLMVKLVNPKDLGIKEFNWSDEIAS